MAASHSALLALAALTALSGYCVCAPQGSVQGGVQGGTQVPPLSHSTVSPGVGGVRKHEHAVHLPSYEFNQYSRGRGYRDWRTRGDPTLINSLWRSRQPLGIRKQLGNAEVYIVLALLPSAELSPAGQGSLSPVLPPAPPRAFLTAARQLCRHSCLRLPCDTGHPAF